MLISNCHSQKHRISEEYGAFFILSRNRRYQRLMNEHAGAEDEEGIESKSYGEMMAVYHFNQSQKDALEEIMKPKYAQMLAELVGRQWERSPYFQADCS